MNCFQRQKGNTTKFIIPVLYILVFGIILIFLMKEIHVLSDKNLAKQKDILQNALNQSMVQCYAVEGRYPESIDYLEKHYGITYDRKHFFVDYEIVGANIMPEITVMEKR